MVAGLIRPDNKQPAEVLQVTPARIALDTSCVSPMRRWWTIAELAAVNDRAALAQACKTPETYRPAWEVNPRALVVWKPLVVYITADMIGSARKGIPGIDIGKSSGVVFKDAEAA